jgi:hypothetical protein
MIDPSPTGFQPVELDGVLLYDARNVEEIGSDLAPLDDDLVVTFALRRLENYDLALRIVA